MGENMGALRDRFAALGLDTAVLDQFDNMGIERRLMLQHWYRLLTRSYKD